MVYYNYKRLSGKYDRKMQELFPTNQWGCAVIEVDNKTGEPLLVEICKVDGDIVHESTWTHYADIDCVDKEKHVYELHERFCGKNEDEMWIYGYFKTFLGAARNLSLRGNSECNRKPKAKY